MVVKIVKALKKIVVAPFAFGWAVIVLIGETVMDRGQADLPDF